MITRGYTSNDRHGSEPSVSLEAKKLSPDLTPEQLDGYIHYAEQLRGQAVARLGRRIRAWMKEALTSDAGSNDNPGQPVQVSGSN